MTQQSFEIVPSGLIEAMANHEGVALHPERLALDAMAARVGLPLDDEHVRMVVCETGKNIADTVPPLENEDDFVVRLAGKLTEQNLSGAVLQALADRARDNRLPGLNIRNRVGLGLILLGGLGLVSDFGAHDALIKAGSSATLATGAGLTFSSNRGAVARVPDNTGLNYPITLRPISRPSSSSDAA